MLLGEIPGGVDERGVSLGLFLLLRVIRDVASEGRIVVGLPRALRLMTNDLSEGRGHHHVGVEKVVRGANQRTGPIAIPLTDNGQGVGRHLLFEQVGKGAANQGD